jgi:hypothetical protein
MCYRTEDGLMLDCREIAEEFFRYKPDIMPADNLPVYLSGKICELQEACGQLPPAFIDRACEIFNNLVFRREELSANLSPAERREQITRDMIADQTRGISTNGEPGASLQIAH